MRGCSINARNGARVDARCILRSSVRCRYARVHRGRCPCENDRQVSNFRLDSQQDGLRLLFLCCHVVTCTPIIPVELDSVMRALSALFLTLAVTTPTLGKSPTFRLNVKGRVYEGTPLLWTRTQVQLLARDGYLHTFDRADPSDVTKVSDRFRSYSAAEMRDDLLQEFGAGFDVTGSNHYLVVHPAGSHEEWANRLEMLYGEMVNYFSVRGISVHEPRFPLVAILFPNARTFATYVRRQGINLGPGYVGFYVLNSNRILMYDSQAGSVDGYAANATTVIHEAAHQTAFNTGIHNRLASPPRWICEGIGTLFEAPGVYNSTNYRNLNDRVNRQQLVNYRYLFPDGPSTADVIKVIADDKYFLRETDRAYALAWAMTFLFAEREHDNLAVYLKKTANRAAWTVYKPADRLGDFVSAFSDDMPLLAADINRFMTKLP